MEKFVLSIEFSSNLNGVNSIPSIHLSRFLGEKHVWNKWPSYQKNLFKFETSKMAKIPFVPIEKWYIPCSITSL